VRLFIGIPLAPEVAGQLAAVRGHLERQADGLRWSAPETWHITLQFLGATTPSQYDCVVSHLGAIKSRPAPVKLEGLGFFERSGVFFAGVHLSPELIALQKSVVSATSQVRLSARGPAVPSPHYPGAQPRPRERRARTEAAGGAAAGVRRL
jgi:RNA 2',3'-cyclic 3'-phosphodiesterase